MDRLGQSRALITGTAYLGLGTLDRDSGSIRVVSWSDTLDGKVSARRDETIPAGDPGDLVAGIAFDAALSPFIFGLHAYDPFESLAASLDRAVAQGARLSTAVWAVMESDLFRFAFDHSFTAALDDAQGTTEWRRFARLNDLYRSCIKAIAPFGIVPPSWNAWLRNEGETGIAPKRSGAGLERLLTRPVGALSAPVRLSSDGGLNETSGTPILQSRGPSE